MLSRKERVIWLFAILASVIATYFIAKVILAPQNSTVIIAAPTSIIADTMQEAEQWFVASNKLIPARDVYSPFNDLKSYQLIYEGGIQNKEPWIDYPEQIALHTFRPPPDIEGYTPSEVSLYFVNHDRNIATVIIKDVSSAGAGATETRIDLVKLGGWWKIVWAGDRFVTAQ